MEFDPTALPRPSVYKLLTGSILPRPIGWISTISAEGQPNLAPFSFFNVFSSNPPVLGFACGRRRTDGRSKDSYLNVQASGEFVANIVTEELSPAMNISATEFPAGVNEFEAAGLTAAPSRRVRPPRVAESPVHFECRVIQTVELGERPGDSSLVLGRIVHIHVREDILIDGDKIDLAGLKPVGRLSGRGYCRVTDVFELVRPPSQVGR